MLQQETRTCYENSESYRAIRSFRDSLNYGMVKYFRNLPSFSFITFLHLCKEWFCMCSNTKQELFMKIQRVMGPFHVLDILLVMIGFDFKGMVVLHVNSSQLCANNNLLHMFVCFVKLQIKTLRYFESNSIF